MLFLGYCFVTKWDYVSDMELLDKDLEMYSYIVISTHIKLFFFYKETILHALIWETIFLIKKSLKV